MAEKQHPLIEHVQRANDNRILGLDSDVRSTEARLGRASYNKDKAEIATWTTALSKLYIERAEAILARDRTNEICNSGHTESEA